MEKPNIVFVMAHPDDVAFSIGGTAYLLKDRYRLHVICACRGERGYTWTGEGRTPPSAELGRQREAEERASCAILGADLSFLDQIDGDIYADQAACERTADLLKQLQPVAVFTLGPLEKPDHAATFGIATKALALADLTWTTELYFPLAHNATYNAHYADVFVNISAVADEKRALIRCHRRHCPTEADVEEVMSASELVGKLARCEYAEAFTSRLPMMAVRWKRKAGSILMDFTA